MPRKLRLESEGGLYHVINRGNYRADIFRSEKTKSAFLKCLGEACEKTGWRVHAWCLMSNHYHLAIETPQANLAEGMHWLQSTFSTRFNRLRRENGHLFQGRYKSLSVDSEALGPLCHYVHLNPVRAKQCSVDELSNWPWSSFHWLHFPKERAPWFTPEAALVHAGELVDSSAGRRKYTEYLTWLNEDEPARKEMHFEEMSTSWAIGSKGFKKALIKDHKELATALKQGSVDDASLREHLLEEVLAGFLKKVGKRNADLAREGKSVPWKLAVAAAMKQKSTPTNRWLGENLHMGNLHEVSRKVAQWLRAPDPRFVQKLALTPNPKG